jgi:hypothetical protein
MADEPKPRVMNWRWRVTLAIALGVATTIVVAWTIALLPIADWLGVAAPLASGISRMNAIDSGPEGPRWVAYGEGTVSPFGSDVDFGLMQIRPEDRWMYRGLRTGWGLGDYVDPDVLASMPRTHGQRMAVHRSGWPIAALEWRQEAAGGPLGFGVTTTGPLIGAIELPATWIPARSPAVLPFLPRWRGLAIDTALFSLIWLAFLLLPRIGRTVEWWARRRCEVCGYDRRGIPRDTRCPECGNLNPRLKPR